MKLKHTLPLYGSLLFFLSCSIVHTQATYREKFGNHSEPLVINRPFKEVRNNLLKGAARCFGGMTKNYASSNAGGTSYQYDVKIHDKSSNESILEIPFSGQSRASFGMKVGKGSSFLAIVDLSGVTKGKTQLKRYYRTKYTGQAIEKWANGSESCPTSMY